MVWLQQQTIIKLFTDQPQTDHLLTAGQMLKEMYVRVQFVPATSGPTNGPKKETAISPQCVFCITTKARVNVPTKPDIHSTRNQIQDTLWN